MHELTGFHAPVFIPLLSTDAVVVSVCHSVAYDENQRPALRRVPPARVLRIQIFAPLAPKKRCQECSDAFTNGSNRCSNLVRARKQEVTREASSPELCPH